MSIDLSNVVGISDERGKIVQIADESGRVIWKAVAMVCVVGYGGEDEGGGYGDYANAYIKHNGVTYTGPATFEAQIGDVITCYAEADESNKIYVNDVHVNPNYYETYSYTVTGNTLVALYSHGTDREAYVKVKEIKAKVFLFSALGFYHYAAEEGMTWAEWVDSEYSVFDPNSARVVIENGYVKLSGGGYYALTLDGVYVKPTDVIVAGADYTNKGFPVTVTIQSENKDYAPIEIDGQVYAGSHVLELLTGTVITCKVQEWSGKAVVTLNGSTVASTSAHTGAYKTYRYTVRRNATIHGYYDQNNVGGRIDITEK